MRDDRCAGRPTSEAYEPDPAAAPWDELYARFQTVLDAEVERDDARLRPDARRPSLHAATTSTASRPRSGPRSSSARRGPSATRAPASRVFSQPGRPRDPFEKLGRRRRGAPATPASRRRVALHIPWDRVEDWRALNAHARGARPADRRDQPEPLPGAGVQARQRLPPGRRAVRRQAVLHLRGVRRHRDAGRLGRRSRSGSPTARTTRARTRFSARRGRLLESPSPRSTRRMPPIDAHARRVQALRAGLLPHRHRRLGLRPARLPGRSASGPRCSSTSATTPRA